MDKQYFQEKCEPIRKHIKDFLSNNLRVFSTSSFQSQSIPLLHILSEVDGFKKVYMTDTGFHFPETLSFAKDVTSQFGLELITISSKLIKHRQLDKNGHFLYVSDPDACCKMNKVDPLDGVIPSFDIWINGIRKDQSSARASMNEFEKTNHKCQRYHPLLDWSTKDIFYYNKIYGLPQHPLDSQGYSSIGCEPCTVRDCDRDGLRNSRWFGMSKTECGLNTDLVSKEI